MRLGDHMMFIQLQLSTQTGARRARPTPVQLPTPHNMTVHDHQEVPSPTFTSEAGSNGIPYNLHQFRSFPESEKVRGFICNMQTLSHSDYLFVWLYPLCYQQSRGHRGYSRKTCFPVINNTGSKEFYCHVVTWKEGGEATWRLPQSNTLATSSSCCCLFSWGDKHSARLPTYNIPPP